MNFEPVTGVRRDERSPAPVLLDPEVPFHRPSEHVLKAVLVERDAEVVDARDPPVARLHDDVDGAPFQLRQPQLEAVAVELLPRHAWLDRHVVVADPTVPGDEIEPEL